MTKDQLDEVRQALEFYRRKEELETCVRWMQELLDGTPHKEEPSGKRKPKHHRVRRHTDDPPRRRSGKSPNHVTPMGGAVLRFMLDTGGVVSEDQVAEFLPTCTPPWRHSSASPTLSSLKKGGYVLALGKLRYELSPAGRKWLEEESDEVSNMRRH